MLLALDTATSTGGVALYAADGLQAEASWRIGRSHSEQLLPMVEHLLSNLGIGAADLTAVAVALGPGSWSGLRVGISTAKGIALARKLPLLGVSSLETLAYPHQRTGRPVFPVIKLGRDRYATAEYRLRRSWGRTGAERNISRQELIESLPDLALVCGDIDVALAAAISAARGAGVVVPMPALSLRRSGYMAEIAWARFASGERDDPVSLEPLYLGQAVREKAAP